jgi:salicylate hydroxylase
MLEALLAAANPQVQNWPIYQVKRLPRWTAESGRFVLMGDAAHAMAFYLSMGVSMAVEDAEMLTGCLDMMERKGGELKDAMKVFEKVRKQRVEAVRDASLHAGNMLHLKKGDDRDARDAALACDGAVEAGVESEKFYLDMISYGIGDQSIRDWCYGYDVGKEIEAAW